MILLKDFVEYVVKNKYVIICVSIVVVLYALGIVEFLTRVIILIALIGIAVFIGKKLQVYYYQKNDESEKK